LEDLRTQFTVSCGLGEAEGWGRWNNDTRVSIRFEGNLPRAFEAHIACAVTSGNVGRAITVIAGGCCRKFVSTRTLKDGLGVAKLAFGSVERARTLEILIPNVGPESTSDRRFLGLALGSLSIVPRAARGVAVRTGANG
jgi:hypothetical protein